MANKINKRKGILIKEEVGFKPVVLKKDEDKKGKKDGKKEK